MWCAAAHAVKTETVSRLPMARRVRVGASWCASPTEVVAPPSAINRSACAEARLHKKFYTHGISG
jgi:hypothetical protein